MSVSDVMVTVAALGALAFVALYAIMAPFYKSESGWNLMTFMVVVACMVCQAIYFRMSGTRAPEWLQVLDWGLVAVIIWWRITILVRAQLSRQPPRQ